MSKPTPPPAPSGTSGSWAEGPEMHAPGTIPGSSTIYPSSILDRAQQFGQSVEPLKRLIGAVDWLNQNILGDAQSQLGNVSPAQTFPVRPTGEVATKVIDLLKNTQ